MDPNQLNVILSALGSLTIVSVIATALVQWLKQHTGGDKAAIAVLAGVSVLGGIIYAIIQHFAHWQMWLASMLAVLAYANTIYTLLIRQFFPNASAPPAV